MFVVARCDLSCNTRCMPPPISTSQDTVRALLERSKRQRAVPIRLTLVQRGRRGHPEPGPLATLVRRRDERGLELLLLVLAMASAPPWNVYRPSQVWARALDLAETPSSVAAISKIWKRLESLSLIERGRKGRRASITPLCEDGSGRSYDHPGRVRDRYFQVPLAYWTGDEYWCRTLNLPEKAILLVALSLADDFILPVERVPDWYGLSTDTATRGISGLLHKGLLVYRQVEKKAPLAPAGYSVERHYRLRSPFRLARDVEAAPTRLRALPR
jgi:hypothetical protein